jgi:dsRNA-specific ribonuclease
VIVADAANQDEFSTLGSGSTKKVASQQAAQKALERLQSSPRE